MVESDLPEFRGWVIAAGSFSESVSRPPCSFGSHSTVAIRTPYLALGDFGEHARPGETEKIRNVVTFVSDVVKLQDQRVTLAAIRARVVQ